MKFIDKQIQKLEYLVTNRKFQELETEAFEIKNQPSNEKDKEYASIKETICAFLNTGDGIILIGIKEEKERGTKNKKYIFKGYNSDFEPSFKRLETEAVRNITGNKVNIADYLQFEIKDFLHGQVLAIHVSKLPHDKRYVFFNKVAYGRKITGDVKIDQNKIDAYEEYKQGLQYAKELHPVINTHLENLSIDKLNEYIYHLNKEIKIESPKANIQQAISFLERKSFITKDYEPTILGMLVCGKHPEDYLGTRCQVDCYVDMPVKIAQNKKIIKDNILQLLESSFGFIYRNIQVGVSTENSGSSIPEYPENLVRECINNSLAHRDYTIHRFINIDIVPQKHIEIRNPGTFKASLLLEELEHEIPIRRIKPNQKPVNPKLADVLKIFNKYEGKGIGMATLVNECLNNKIDLPYYKFNAENDISLVIPSGKLLDDTIDNLLDTFSGYIDEVTEGEELTDEQKHILAYLYKSEIANENYQYTILLTRDNNHANAIKSLEKCGLIYKHQASTNIFPVYILNRTLMKENFNSELINIFGEAYKTLPRDYKDCLKIIYKINTYSKNSQISASQVGNILYIDRFQKVTDLKAFDNFKRKIRNVFNKLTGHNFIIEERKGRYRNYLINKNRPKKELFD